DLHVEDDRTGEHESAGDTRSEHALSQSVASLMQAREDVIDACDKCQTIDLPIRSRDDAIDRVLFDDVPGDGRDVRTGLGGDELLQTLFGEVDGDHAPALAGHACGDGCPDPSRSTGDDVGLSLKSCAGWSVR